MGRPARPNPARNFPSPASSISTSKFPITKGESFLRGSPFGSAAWALRQVYFEAPQELWELHSSTSLASMIWAQLHEFLSTLGTSFNPSWRPR